MLSSPRALESGIPCDHDAKETHAFLHLITRHFVEIQQAGKKAHTTMIEQLDLSIKLLDKYQCDRHLGLIEGQALLILYSGGHCILVMGLAENGGWIKVVKQCIEMFGDFAMKSRSNSHVFSMDPENWKVENVEMVGIKTYLAFIDACALATKDLPRGTVERSRSAQALRRSGRRSRKRLPCAEPKAHRKNCEVGWEDC